MSLRLELRPATECAFDVVSLGEVMLRLDPGEDRVRTARWFRAWEGGGEYNVARGLRRCFGQRSAIVTALVDNEVGRLIEDLMLTGGVDTSLVHWVDDDGVGRRARNGLNFTERGFGVRAARGTSDRANTAASQLRPGDIDWAELFERRGVRWFHTGGIFAALSPTTAELTAEALAAARRHGVLTSYDLNYRPSLWSAHGGSEAAVTRNRAIVEHVDVLLGNEEDFAAALGISAGSGLLDEHSFGAAAAKVVLDFPQLQLVAATLRHVHSATVNDWGAMAWTQEGVVCATRRERLEILDRVGGGDSFAAGLIYGLLTGTDVRHAVELGAAHGALAMTTPGDTSSARLDEVERLAGGGDARVQR